MPEHLTADMGHESEADRERRLLEDPVTNAGELYNVYHNRLMRLSSHHSERADEGERKAFSELFSDLCNRQLMVSRFLPEEDPRSYAAWKKEFNANRTRLQR